MSSQNITMAPRSTPKFKIAVRVFSLLAIILTSCYLGISWWVNTEFDMRMGALAEKSNTSESHQSIYEFFESFPNTVSSGEFDLLDDAPGKIIQQLKIVDQILEDDYLLEAKSHHRKFTRNASESGVFSFNNWIASDKNTAWRSRLL